MTDKEKITTLIDKRSKDTFLNHLVTFFGFRGTKGDIQKDIIVFWDHNHFLGGGYPVFTFEFNDKNKLISVTHKSNPIAKIFQWLILILLVIGVYNFFETEVNFISKIIIALMALPLFFAILFVGVKIYKFEKDIQLKKILRFIKMRTISISNEEIKDKESFHDTFSKRFDFPDFYGRNMDAWIDSIEDSIEEPVNLVFTDYNLLSETSKEIVEEVVQCSKFVNERLGEQLILITIDN